MEFDTRSPLRMPLQKFVDVCCGYYIGRGKTKRNQFDCGYIDACPGVFPSYEILQLRITALSPPPLLSGSSIQLEEAIRLTPQVGTSV